MGKLDNTKIPMTATHTGKNEAKGLSKLARPRARGV